MASHLQSKIRRSPARGSNRLLPSAPPLQPTTPLFITGKNKTPYSIQRDYRVLEREKRVTTILSNDSFRAKLESILQAQKDGSAQLKRTNLQKLQQDATTPPNRSSKTTGAIRSATETIIPIDDLRGVIASKYTLAEKQTRCKLAAVYRLIEMFGWSQLIYNSITACLPGESPIVLVNPFGLLYGEITASRLVAADLDGNVVDPGTTQLGVNQPGFILHACIHSARRDIKCVAHVHTNAGVALSSMSCGLLPVSEEAISLGGISYHDGQHLSTDDAKRQIGEDLGPTNKVLVLRNHGLVALGESIEEAFHITYKLVKACEIQVSLMSVGLDNITQCKGVWSKSRPCQGGVDREATFTILDSISRKWGPGELEFEALMRMLDNKGYNTGYQYRALNLLEPDNGKSGIWSTGKDENWNFLDQRKINQTEPVIRDRSKAAQKRHTEQSKQKNVSVGKRETTGNDPGLSPLAQAEQTALQVANSTGEAVQRLANDPSLLEQSQITPSHTNNVSALEMAQHTAERVAKSTGRAVMKLTQDFAVKSLQNSRFPDYIRTGDLETNSEPSLLIRGNYDQLEAKLLDRAKHSGSLRQLNELKAADDKISTPHQKDRMGLLSFHRSPQNISLPEGLSSLEMTTHIAERVAGSTGEAVVTLSGSLTATP